MPIKVKPQTITVISIVIALLSLFFAYTVWAGTGTTDSSNPPANTSSYTLEDIYNSLNDGSAGTQSTFTEPGVAPGTGTMYTLNDIYNLTRERALVSKTGQTTNYATGDDGDLERGVIWPSPRFTDNADGTVTDNLTGLIWLQNANCWGMLIWTNALSNANGLADGSCGLTDGSVASDWRLPNVNELYSLIDFSQYTPAIPSGHPFTSVQPNIYWSSTHDAIVSTTIVWHVGLNHGHVNHDDITFSYYTWPVRAGQ
ncbi:MAG: DUF1566 domain-containing protein [Chloroflexi bacterium]|nr:DUF1566 domain-containing protein [Chloroflexota bacterium]